MFSELHFMYFCYNEWIVLTIFPCAFSMAEANISVLPFHMCIYSTRALYIFSITFLRIFRFSAHNLFILYDINHRRLLFFQFSLLFRREHNFVALVYGNTNNENIKLPHIFHEK